MFILLQNAVTLYQMTNYNRPKFYADASGNMANEIEISHPLIPNYNLFYKLLMPSKIGDNKE